MSEMDQDMNPNAEFDLFVGATTRDDNNNMLCMDLTGKLPVQMQSFHDP